MPIAPGPQQPRPPRRGAPRCVHSLTEGRYLFKRTGGITAEANLGGEAAASGRHAMGPAIIPASIRLVLALAPWVAAIDPTGTERDCSV